MQKSYVDYSDCKCGISGSKKGVSGVRFNLSPMSDDYINIILGALDKVDRSKVWSATDPTSTVYRSDRSAIFDCIKAFYKAAYRPGVHMNLNATFSKGCPGDTDADYTLNDKNYRANEEKFKDIHFDISGKFALYIFGENSYMKEIETVVNMGVDRNVIGGTGHYTTFLKGDVDDIFSYLEDVFAYLEDRVSHFVIETSLLINLPEEE